MLLVIDSFDLKLIAKIRHLKEVNKNEALTEHMIILTMGCYNVIALNKWLWSAQLQVLIHKIAMHLYSSNTTDEYVRNIVFLSPNNVKLR